MKISQLPCLWYKITDVRMFKLGNVPGHEWTKRWANAKVHNITGWASPELRNIKITQGYSKKALTLVVRWFKPMPGDKLSRTWADGNIKKSVELPPYAIVDLSAATQTYKDYINQEGPQFLNSILSYEVNLLRGTYNQAIYESNHVMVWVPLSFPNRSL
jgi:hypothetical protein